MTEQASGASAPHGERPEGRAEVTAAVLDVAVERFAARGPNRVSIREIAEAAQVNHALVHRHFKTKQALLRAVMARLTPSAGKQITEETTWDDAVRLVFATDTAHATYARMLAWLLLEADVDTALLDDFPVIDTLVELAARRSSEGDDEARLQVAAVELLALGWQLFGPYVRQMMQLEHLPPDVVEQRIAEFATRIGTPPT